MPSISHASTNGDPVSTRRGGVVDNTYFPSSQELKDRATVQSRPGVTIKSWIELAYSLYLKWLSHRKENNLPECIVSYIKAYRIICDIIPNDPLWERFVARSSDLFFRFTRLRMDINGDFGDFEKILSEVDSKHEHSIQTSYSSDRFSNGEHLTTDLASRFEKVKARPVIARKPLGPRDLSTKNVFKGQPPPIPTSSTSVSSKLTSPNGSPSLLNNSIPSPIPSPSPSFHSSAMLTPQPSSQQSGIPTSPPLMDIHNKLNNFNFPKTNVINAETLFGYLTKKDIRLDILVIDMRSREAFEEGHIFAPAVICIEPIILRDRMNGDQLEEALFDLHPNEEEMFLKRHSYDLVVYHDYCSSSELESPEHKLRQLREAIFDLASYRKDLRRSPVLLVGGLEAWVELLGTQSLRRGAVRSGSLTSSKTARANGKSPSPNPGELIIRKTPRDNAIYMPPIQNGNVRRQHRQASIVASDPQFARTIQDFFQRYPSHGTQESMTSPPPTRYSSNTPTRSSSSNTVIDHPFHGFSDTASMRPEEPHFGRLNVARQAEQDFPKKVAQFPDLHGDGDHGLSQYSGVPWVSAGTTGLKNLGNTCYMNSIIQCLSGTYPLSRHIKTGAFKKFVNTNNPLGYKGHLIDNYADLVVTMWSGQQTFVSPEKFRALVGTLQPQFRDSNQQDAQEFLAFLLDGLHEEMNMAAARAPLRELTEEEERRRENMPIQKVSQIEWSRYLHRNQTLVTDCFQGQFRSRLRCLTCHFTSTTYNAFMYLSLPLDIFRNKASCTLHECLDAFVREEILEDDDSWHCPKCNRSRRSSKELSISRLPNILIIHLKRFETKGVWRDKLNNFVDFPIRNLDLTHYTPDPLSAKQMGGVEPDPSQQPPFLYDLYGVCNHFGSMNGGHYTAFVRNGNGNQWNVFDDSRVTTCSETSVVSRSAYVLFFVRKNISW